MDAAKHTRRTRPMPQPQPLCGTSRRRMTAAAQARRPRPKSARLEVLLRVNEEADEVRGNGGESGLRTRACDPQALSPLTTLEPSTVLPPSLGPPGRWRVAAAADAGRDDVDDGNVLRWRCVALDTPERSKAEAREEAAAEGAEAGLLFRSVVSLKLRAGFSSSAEAFARSTRVRGSAGALPSPPTKDCTFGVVRCVRASILLAAVGPCAASSLCHRRAASGQASRGAKRA